jgi:hypothetical protein
MTSPEHLHLRRVLTSLAARLDEQTEGLSAAQELEEPRQALARLTDPARASEVLEAFGAELAPAEAAWLAEEVLRRWGLLGTPVVDPVVRVVPTSTAPPVDVVVDPTGAAEPHHGTGTTVRLRVEVDGLDPGWTVAWTGAHAQPSGASAAGEGEGSAQDGENGAWALWTGEAAVVTARVMGRGAEGRVVLTASWRPEGTREVST